MPLTPRQGLQAILADNRIPLMELVASGPGCSITSSDPHLYTAYAEFVGRSRYMPWRSEDHAYNYLPSFGFTVTIDRTVESPFKEVREDGSRCLDHVAFSSRSLSSCIGGPREGRTIVDLTLPDGLTFFTTLDDILGSDRFRPFEVRGDLPSIKNMRSRASVSVNAFVGSDEIHGELIKFEGIDVAEMILKIIRVFEEESPCLHVLEFYYKEKDENGRRLWADQGLQSDQYYRHLHAVSRRLLNRVRKVTRSYGFYHRKSWGPLHSLRNILYMTREYGPLIGLLGFSQMAFNRIRLPFLRTGRSLYPKH